MKVKINLRNGFYFSGEVISEDDNFINIIDKKGKPVSISKKDIVTKEEIDGNS